MENILFILSVVLTIAWSVGYIGYREGGAVHILLGMAAVLTIYRYLFVKEYKN